MYNYIWNNTYSLEFLSEDFYDLNISTKDNVYEIIKKKKDENEVESLSINISSHICMFVQLIDNIIGKLSYNNDIINDTLNYKKLSDVFNFIKNQLYNCDYSLFLRIYSIYHTYNHRKNGYLDVNNLYNFILDIINKIENLNENNFLILPGGFYLQKEKMLVKILYIIHRKNNLYSFAVLNNSIYGTQYHSFKIDDIDNLGILLRDVVLCIKNIQKNYLTNSLFWLCLYRLYIFPNADNVDILYQILLPYLNNSFLTNNWNICDNNTINVVSGENGSKDQSNDLMNTNNNISNNIINNNINSYNNNNNNNNNNTSFDMNFSNFNNNLNNDVNKVQANYGNGPNYMNKSGNNFNDFHNFNNINNLNDFDVWNNFDFNNSDKFPNDFNSFNDFDINMFQNNNNNVMMTSQNAPVQFSEQARYNDNKNMRKKKIRENYEKYGGIYVNLYKDKFTSFSMSLYYSMIYMLKVMNIEEEDIEVFKIFIYYSIILKLCDDLMRYEYIERRKNEMGNIRSSQHDNGINNNNEVNHNNNNNNFYGNQFNNYNNNFSHNNVSSTYNNNNSELQKSENKNDPNRIDDIFFVFLDMSVRKLCVLFHLYFCKMKVDVYDKSKMIRSNVLNEIMKKILFVKYMYNKIELKLHSDLTLNVDIIKNRNYMNSIKFPMYIKFEEELYKSYRKVEIKKDINMPISFYISRRNVENFNDLYVILYETNLITNILIIKKVI
ncbi:conserved Plasmodium protein, unknown function [Plasmodium sp. DRC-Itaito]|nr:conserved Plasmodium protein, unknown function [Plasmodium sp. DRC-Itaito]